MDNSFEATRMKLIVITGGPGGGKTAILEMAKKILLSNSVILPEAASIIFGGGFWRLPSLSAKAAAQRAIFHVQTEMENLVCDENKWVLGFCDRGTLDGLAYWPNSEESFWEISKSSLEKELSKYYAVIHLRSPSDLFGYNHINPLRIESSAQSKTIDDKIANIWKNHPRYEVINSSENFLTKAQIALDLIAKHQSTCCS
ncbi:MAG: ATP-binding protein [Bacteriovorax sp.]|nr:ATP-binding protein [Bacteriovorax sp.]